MIRGSAHREGRGGRGRGYRTASVGARRSPDGHGRSTYSADRGAQLTRPGGVLRRFQRAVAAVSSTSGQRRRISRSSSHSRGVSCCGSNPSFRTSLDRALSLAGGRFSSTGPSLSADWRSSDRPILPQGNRAGHAGNAAVAWHFRRPQPVCRRRLPAGLFRVLGSGTLHGPPERTEDTMATRPVECPVCGHEGINRATAGLDGRAGRGQVAAESWTCRLCAYSWSQPPRERRVIEGPDQLRM